MSALLDTSALGKRYRRTWALRDCTLTIPEPSIVGIAGPNGAGKSTLLGLAVGLLEPSEGSVTVRGRDPRRDSAALADIGYVGQGAPLYRGFTVGEMLDFARISNPRWDQALATELLSRSSPGTQISALSPGECAHLALALALGKRPALLLLDEPFARLDPLASRELLRLLMEGAAEIGSAVVVATRVLTDIERVCERVVLLGDGHVGLDGTVEELLASHRLLTGARRPLGRIRGVEEIVRERSSGRQLTLLVRTNGPIVDPTWSVEQIGLEELLLAYMAPEELPSPRPPEPSRLRWHG
ncbi:MAG: type transport system ATP-binding protein [Gaiellaceae bacterium]|jgi:ABC-2 type transport system ATP-binding protein|nr:type transport system ATP-binding protein [Gaiellaceae bacterium]MDX6509298.1 type transport system ATP-binding protein [Gaiellaceae bacterium]